MNPISFFLLPTIMFQDFWPFLAYAFLIISNMASAANPPWQILKIGVFRHLQRWEIRMGHFHLHANLTSLRPPYVIGQAIVFLPCGSFYLSVFIWSPYGIGQTIVFLPCVMAALCNRCGDYFCPLISIFFLLSLFSSPNLSDRRLDVYHTSTHGVALVRV